MSAITYSKSPNGRNAKGEIGEGRRRKREEKQMSEAQSPLHAVSRLFAAAAAAAAASSPCANCKYATFVFPILELY